MCPPRNMLPSEKPIRLSSGILGLQGDDGPCANQRSAIVWAIANWPIHASIFHGRLGCYNSLCYVRQMKRIPGIDRAPWLGSEFPKVIGYLNSQFSITSPNHPTQTYYYFYYTTIQHNKKVCALIQSFLQPPLSLFFLNLRWA